MKKAKIFKVVIIGVLMVLTGCNRDELVEESLPGEWVEVWPEAERSTLLFTSNQKMTLLDGGGNSEDYTYEVERDSIYLKSSSGSEGATALYFNKLEPGRFKIGNLYPSIPESEPIHMIFERK